MLLVIVLVISKQESVSLVTTKTIATCVTLELDGTGGYPDDSSSCGNEAKHFPDNAKKHIKTMGCILVQQKETYLG